MTQITHILEHRLLAALAQAASTRLPAPWEELRPEQTSHLRPAAAVLLGVAERASREGMTASLRATAERIQKRRDDRKGGEAELFRRTADLVEALGEPLEKPQGGGEPQLFGLRLWHEIEDFPLNPMRASFRALGRQSQPVTEPWLTAAARVLLLARAQAWEDEARAEERTGKEATHVLSNTPTAEGAAS